MKMKKLSQTLTKYKLQLLVTVLVALGLYHILMSLVKENVFNLDKNEIDQAKFMLIRFYHVSCSLLIGIGFSFSWTKKINCIWIYLVFRAAYTISRLFPTVDEMLTKTLMDGMSFGIVIIVILLILVKDD